MRQAKKSNFKVVFAMALGIVIINAPGFNRPVLAQSLASNDQDVLIAQTDLEEVQRMIQQNPELLQQAQQLLQQNPELVQQMIQQLLEQNPGLIQQIQQNPQLMQQISQQGQGLMQLLQNNPQLMQRLQQSIPATKNLKP